MSRMITRRFAPNVVEQGVSQMRVAKSTRAGTAHRRSHEALGIMVRAFMRVPQGRVKVWMNEWRGCVQAHLPHPCSSAPAWVTPAGRQQRGAKAPRPSAFAPLAVGALLAAAVQCSLAVAGGQRPLCRSGSAAQHSGK